MPSPKLMFERRGTALHPTDPWSLERLCAYPERTPLGVTLTSARRRGKNALYWAGLALLVENIEDEHYPTSRKLHEGILDELNMTTILWRIDKTFRVVPDSIAFDNMDDPEFDIFFENAQRLIVGRWGWSPFDEWIKLAEAKKHNQEDWRRNYRQGDE